ncbi:MAG: hypothetical protein NTV34_00915 [Proteobacteria bacterium]|nr:hypothetical protein [Pseudomonadota bacterium]
MPVIYPSQIVEFIDNHFPAHMPGESLSGIFRNRPIQFKAQAYSKLSALIAMVNACPDTMLPADAARFMIHFTTLRTDVEPLRRWDWAASPVVASSLGKLDGESEFPVEGLYNLFKNCKDEATSVTTADLPFVLDTDYRELLRLDWSNVDSALENGEWKAATVLAGSLLEAILLVALQRINIVEINNKCSILRSQGKLRNLRVQASVDLTDLGWTLAHYIELASELSLITEETKGQAEIAREFRNLIHPAKAQRQGINCDRGTARAAAAAVDMAVRDLSKFSF